MQKRLWQLAAVAVAAVGSGALGQSGDLGRLIEALDADDWTIRQQAEDALRLRLTDLTELERTLEEIDGELSAEARRRLTMLGEAAFMASPRPGVGAQFSGAADGEGARIERTVKGFDADKQLQRGDTILSFGGIPTPTYNDMLTAIMVYDPEDVVEVTLRRDNEVVRTKVRLGWYRDLNNAGGPDRGAMRRAWAIRAGRHLSAPDQAVDLGCDLALWRDADEVNSQAQSQWRQNRRGSADPVPSVTGAGMSADPDRMSPRGRAMMSADLRRDELLQQIDERIDSVVARITALEAEAEAPDITADRAAELAEELKRLREVHSQLSALRNPNGFEP